MPYTKDLKTKYETIQSIKKMMLWHGLDLSDLKPLVPVRKKRQEALKKLAGVWKNKDIDALKYQDKVRDELSTIS